MYLQAKSEDQAPELSVEESGIAILEQPPYSTDLSPCDFFLLPKFKDVKGTCFPDVEAIKRAVTTELQKILSEAHGVAEQDEKVHWTREGLFRRRNFVVCIKV